MNIHVQTVQHLILRQNVHYVLIFTTVKRKVMIVQNVQFSIIKHIVDLVVYVFQQIQYYNVLVHLGISLEVIFLLIKIHVQNVERLIMK